MFERQTLWQRVQMYSDGSSFEDLCEDLRTALFRLILAMRDSSASSVPIETAAFHKVLDSAVVSHD